MSPQKTHRNFPAGIQQRRPESVAGGIGPLCGRAIRLYAPAASLTFPGLLAVCLVCVTAALGQSARDGDSAVVQAHESISIYDGFLLVGGGAVPIRKSITFYDGFLLPRSVTLPRQDYDSLRRQLHQALDWHERMARYDRNPIPAPLIDGARIEVSRLDSINAEQVAGVLTRTMGADLLRVLEEERDWRAARFVTEQERVNFLTQKARDLGVTAEDLDLVMNSAYVVVPYISHYARGVEKNVYGDKCEVYYLWGGFVVFHLEVQGAPGFTAYGKRSTSGKGRSIPEAGRTFLHETEVYVRELIPEFGCVELNRSGRPVVTLGSSSGVKMDDKYEFFEWREGKGTVRRTKVAFGTVTSVRDNESEIGTVYGRIAPGMDAVECPMAPVEILLSAVSFPMRMSSHSGMNMFSLERPNRLCLGTNSVLVIADTRWLISGLTGIPQSYLTLSLYGIGLPIGARLGDTATVCGLSIDGHDVSAAYGEWGKLGLMKRFYWNRMGFGLQASAKLWFAGLSVPHDSSDKTFQNPTTGVHLGGEASAFLEFVITPRISIGFQASLGRGKAAVLENAREGEKLNRPARVGPLVSLETPGYQLYVLLSPSRSTKVRNCLSVFTCGLFPEF